MLALLQHFLPRPKVAPLPDCHWLEDWAHLRGDELKRVRGRAGFVLANEFHGRPLRIECGASQRDYIVGNEVRLRYELGLPRHGEMLLLSRSLAEQLEQRTFEDLTDGDQTDVTATLPEEARWLAMFERVDLSGLPAGFGKRFVVVAAQPELAVKWLRGEPALRLMRASTRWLSAEAPLVMMTLKGRLYVRAEAQHLDQTMLDSLRGISDAAAVGALEVVRKRRRSSRDEAADEDRVVDELRALDEALRQAAVPEGHQAPGMQGFEPSPSATAGPSEDTIDGLSVVICDSPSLPPMDFSEPSTLDSELPAPSILDEEAVHADGTSDRYGPAAGANPAAIRH